MLKEEKDLFEQNQEQEIKKKSFKCLSCYKYARHPVLTRCGHIFCWECLYKLAQRTKQCPYCKQQCTITDCYPVYTDHHQQQTSKQNQQQPNSQNQLSSQQIDNQLTETFGSLPPRPVAIHKPKIINPNMIGVGLPIASNNLPSNVNMGKLIAGHVFMSPLGVNAVNSIDQGRQNDQDYEKGQKIKIKMHLVIIFTILLLVYCFLV